MAKNRYRFNNKTLEFEKVQVTSKDRLLKFFSHLLTGVVFAIAIILFAYNFLESPKEKMQQREIDNLALNYEILSNRLKQVVAVVEDL